MAQDTHLQQHGQPPLHRPRVYRPKHPRENADEPVSTPSHTQNKTKHARREPHAPHPASNMHLADPNHRLPTLLRPIPRPHRRDVILHPPHIRHRRRERAHSRRRLLRRLRRGDLRRERRDEVREARLREPRVVLLFDLAHRGEEARLARGQGRERGVGDAVGRVDDARDEVPAAVDGGREAVCERDAVRREGVRMGTRQREKRGIARAERDVQAGAVHSGGVDLVGRDGVLLEGSDDGGRVDQLRERKSQSFQGARDFRGLLRRELDEEPVGFSGGPGDRGVAVQAVRGLKIRIFVGISGLYAPGYMRRTYGLVCSCCEELLHHRSPTRAPVLPRPASNGYRTGREVLVFRAPRELVDAGQA